MNKKTLKRIICYCKPYKIYLVLSVIFAIISVVFTLILPIVIGDTIDLMIGYKQVNLKQLINQIIFIGIIVISGAFFQYLMTRCTNKITYQSIRDLRRDYFDKLQKLPLKYVDSKLQGDFINRMLGDIDLIGEGLLTGFASLLTGIMIIIGTIIFMLSINISVALLVIIMTPLSLLVASFIAKKTFDLFKEQLDLRSELGGYVEEHISNLKLIKAFSYEDRAVEKYKEINERMNANGVKSQFASALINPSARFINNLVYMAVGVLGGLLVINRSLSIGQLSSFLTYATQYTKPFNEISGVIAEFQTALASAQRVFEVLDQKNQEDKGNYFLDNNKIKGNVSFKNVDFSYNLSNPFIKDLSFEVLKGQKIALVGPTGCGKTTIINLLMRFYEVNKGLIEVDGIDIKKLSMESLRSCFGMVLQDTWMFKGSVKENIAYGNPNASDEEIIKASKLAYAHHFIEQLPLGYDSIIEENGGNISDGQKQLLCIARIMLSKPAILILDEATSNIDTRTELLVQQAFSEMMQDKTSFIVAHRLSTIKNADLILVLKDGVIIESGKHDELLNYHGFYHYLYHSQFVKNM
jgi:ABC-type multidrug transport system, ATPase and permease components